MCYIILWNAAGPYVNQKVVAHISWLLREPAKPFIKIKDLKVPVNLSTFLPTHPPNLNPPSNLDILFPDIVPES